MFTPPFAVALLNAAVIDFPIEVTCHLPIAPSRQSSRGAANHEDTSAAAHPKQPSELIGRSPPVIPV